MTTLASAMAYVELLQQAQLIAVAHFNPIEAYTTIALIFFVILWPLVQLDLRCWSARLQEATTMTPSSRVEGLHKRSAPTTCSRASTSTSRRASASPSWARSGSGKSTLAAVPQLHGVARAPAASTLDGKADRRASAGEPPRYREAELARAPAGRHGLPAVQSLPAHDRARQRDGRPAHRASARRPRRGRAPRRSWRGSVWPTRPTRIPHSFRAARSSGWRSRGRWPWTRSCCCSTSRPPRSIRSWWARCWAYPRAGRGRPHDADGHARARLRLPRGRPRDLPRRRPIHEQGTPDEVLKHPKQERTQAFLASHNEFSF